MKPLLTVSALLEAGTGLGLLVVPAIVAQLLLGTPLNTPAALTVARVGGTALFSIGLACWLSRENGPPLVATMLFYNVGAAAVLAYAAVGLALSGIGLWPAIGLHTVLAVWCAAALTSKRAVA
jgi:hypothetical protein